MDDMTVYLHNCPQIIEDGNNKSNYCKLIVITK